MHYGFNGFGGWGMILFWIIIIGVIILVIKALYNQADKKTRLPSKTPMDILKERYASGDISREEFQSKKHDLLEK